MINMNDLLQVLMVLMQALIGGIGIYQAAIGLAGFFRRKETRNAPVSKSFAVLIAAHNEEAVVGSLLENLRKLDYPAELFEIFVIADHCTDGTAGIARSREAHVLERSGQAKRGKGHAIEWALNRLWKHGREFDGVIILDADNLVSPNFLLEMNEKLSNGDKVIQAYLETKNPYDSWVTVSYALMYWYMNRIWQLARYNLGLPNVLGGTGICIEAQLLKEIGWGAQSLTEDVEFTARCVERGIYPTWAHDAICYDEKPVDLYSSLRQRLRWMQGHVYCARKYFGKLIRMSVANRNPAQFDAALYLFQPFRFLVYAVYLGMLYAQVATGSLSRWGFHPILPDWFWVAVSAVLYLQTPAVLLLERKPLKAYLGYIPYQLFLLTWFPVTLWAFFTSNNQNWSHTKHTRAVTIEDLHGEAKG